LGANLVVFSLVRRSKVRNTNVRSNAIRPCRGAASAAAVGSRASRAAISLAPRKID